MSTIEGRGAREFMDVTSDWTWPERRYECRVLLCPEEEGGYSAHALNIAGVVSEGETTEEALRNISDAFKATVEYHLESGSRIPWGAEDRAVFAGIAGTIERWIAVDV